MKKLFCLIFITSFVFGFDFDQNGENSPLKGGVNLGNAISVVNLSLENDNPILGADFDADTNEFTLVSKENEFYITNSEFKPLRYAKHDRHFMLELENTISAAWVKNNVLMMSYNKSFVIYEPANLREKNKINEQWKHLLKGYDKWKLVDKNRFFTLRAKQQYILSAEFEPNKNIFIIASVPNDVRDYWSIGVFDGDDKMILEEYIPKIGGNLSFVKGGNLGKFYIVGMDAQNDDVYLLSKNYSTILKLNLISKVITEAYTFSGVPNPTALAIKDNKFYIFSRDNQKENKIYIFDMKKG